MSLLTGIVISNVSLALLGAVLVWQVSMQSADLRTLLGRFARLATTDTLTDLPNRTKLQEHLADALKADGPEPALLLIDLDGFKVVNDTLGHETGDELLKSVASRIGTCLHPEDLLARLGGDEFAALITRPSADTLAKDTARHIDDMMKTPFRVHEDLISVGASIGIAPSPGKGTDASELLRRADVAMYVAKSDKQNRFHVYSPTMDETLRLRHTISLELDRALSENQLKLVYQPLVCARTGKVMSAEALMRWPGKEGQAGSPGIFIPIAEETGLISRLGEWALDQAMLEIKRQRTIPIAVNVSPIQFRVDGFADSVEAALERHGVDPSLLHIEITEGVLISHTDEAQRTMKRLRDMGVLVMLDDFGTGYSSLSYLQQFEFDGLKIDRAFIQQLEFGPTGRQLLKSIIALGHSLNMKVVAEGVETEDQAAILQLLSCDFLQGYALGRPDAADKLHSVTRPSELLGSTLRTAGWGRAAN
ncbi:putative bifunctional diguanylate cyclase/phosphodiesterase [Hyphomonas johnsonii]|uniref:Periplasmic sensor diguanylate cyclase/phosphodiesterase n=1 Tax=Hyphomonas johnsonii MHS-2 TaxID=1280950 RepID=A0A059FP10_9PROT|nr:EAL domain-containing protein [Hyphomonas johnsonii]KCZ92261.1 periplasmic sensor diguanylate cyclase/phosphodiesterase [Hyphomonas johnsonii MHS-2]